jgi:hypothetical protein
MVMIVYRVKDRSCYIWATVVKQPVDRVGDKRAVMETYAAFYNQRGGTVEIEIKEDKQGVDMTKRSNLCEMRFR